MERIAPSAVLEAEIADLLSQRYSTITETARRVRSARDAGLVYKRAIEAR